MHIGFQRRFDSGYQRLAAGGAGRRARLRPLDPGRPPTTRRRPHAAYIPTSGGLFRDCSVHDFDILRFVTGREVVSVYATGANKGEPFFAEAGDVDTAAAVLTLDDGTLVSVTATRYNGGGHDVRMEVHGSKGAMAVGLDDSLALRSAEEGVDFPGGPQHWSFMERFLPAYVAELTAFAEVARGDRRRRAPSRRPRGLPRRRGLRAVPPRGARRAPGGDRDPVSTTILPLEERVAGAPISWGVCEVPGWGWQYDPETVLPRCATSAWPRPSSARTASCPTTRRPRPTSWPPRACGRRASSSRSCCTTRATTRCPRSSARWRASSRQAPRPSCSPRRPVRRATTTAPCSTTPAGRPCWTTSTGSTRGRRSRGLMATLHPHVGTMVESGEEIDRVLAGSASGSASTPGTCSSAAATRSPSRKARPTGSPTCTSRTSASTGPRVQAGEATYTEAVAGGMYVPLGEGDVDIAAIVNALEDDGYAGWYVLEQDTILRAPAAPARPRAASARRSTSGPASTTCSAWPRSAPGWGSEHGTQAGTAAYDLVAMGRIGRRHLPAPDGVGLEDVATFQKFLGGSATNVAVAAARYGRRRADHPHRRGRVRPLRPRRPRGSGSTRVHHRSTGRRPR